MIFLIAHATLATIRAAGLSGVARIVREIGMAGLFATSAGILSAML